jgi:hypothetical protein
MEILVNMESRVTQHSGNIEHRVRQDSEGKDPEVRNDATLSQRPAPQWCPRGITKMQKRKLQKMCQRELLRRRKKSGIIGLTIYGP